MDYAYHQQARERNDQDKEQSLSNYNLKEAQKSWTAEQWGMFAVGKIPVRCSSPSMRPAGGLPGYYDAQVANDVYRIKAEKINEWQRRCEAMNQYSRGNMPRKKKSFREIQREVDTALESGKPPREETLAQIRCNHQEYAARTNLWDRVNQAKGVSASFGGGSGEAKSPAQQASSQRGLNRVEFDYYFERTQDSPHPLDAAEAKRSDYAERAYRINLSGNRALKTASSTKTEYIRIAHRQEQVRLEQMPDYLATRREDLSRTAWWKEQSVARKTLLSASLDMERQKNIEAANMLKALEADCKSMQWSQGQVITMAQHQQNQQARLRLDEVAHRGLLDHTRNRGDLELHDTLVISRNTGLRPKELENGVSMKVEGDTVAIHIETAKKTAGNKQSEQRAQQVRKGIDRQLVIESAELAEVARRNNGYFKTDNVHNVQNRLNTARKHVDGAEDISLYTYRHNFKSELQEQGKTRKEIAASMGHRGEKSQNEYGRF